MKHGSISTGTLKSDDLIIAMVNELHNDDEVLKRLQHQTPNVYTWLFPDVGDAEYEDFEKIEVEEVHWAMDLLTERLNEEDYCEDFFYFGAHPGDGADIGFWPDIAAIENAVHCKEVLNYDDMPEFVVHVNDHGNVTLYRIKLEEVWAVV